MRLLLLALCVTGLVRGADAPRPIVLKAARLFDGKTDNVVSPGLVVIFNGKIQAVGPNATVPADARVIDLGDATLLPGFMDAHTHLSAEFNANYTQAMVSNLRKTPAELALDATVGLKTTLMAGITTARDVGGQHFIDVAMRNAIADGHVVGPRLLVAVHAIGSTGGHCDDTAGLRPGLFGRETGPEDGVINSPDEARRAVRLNLKYGADVIKTCATGGVLSLADEVDTPQLTQAELDALVDEAHALRRKTAAHAHGATGAKRAIRAGIDSIEHGSFLDDEALDMMKARGTYLVPTLMAVEGVKIGLEKGTFPPEIEKKARAAMAALNETVRKALAKGVKIAMGTDAAVYPHGQNVHELTLLVNLGMKPAAALRAATSVDAELFGLSDRLGSLESGKIADVIAVPGNPLDDIRQSEKVFFVMKEGVIYKNEKP